MPAPEVLTRRVGPWPLWGWAAIGAVGIGGGILLRRTALFAGDDEDQADEAAAEQPTGYLVGPTLVSGGRAPAGTIDPGTTPEPVPATNDQWASRAITWLIARGVSPTLADSAVRRYLLGMALDAQQAAAVDLVLASSVGVPPEGVPPAEAPKPPSPIPPPPVPPAPAGKKPAPPAWLKAKGGRNGASLDWPAVSGATAYDYRRMTANTTTPWVATTATSAQSHARVARPTQYRYAVRARNKHGVSTETWSAVVWVTP